MQHNYLRWLRLIRSRTWWERDIMLIRVVNIRQWFLTVSRGQAAMDTTLWFQAAMGRSGLCSLYQSNGNQMDGAGMMVACSGGHTLLSPDTCWNCEESTLFAFGQAIFMSLDTQVVSTVSSVRASYGQQCSASTNCKRIGLYTRNCHVQVSRSARLFHYTTSIHHTE